jgi:phosphoribosylformylglycinamidine (FGAM) synthase PurS component
MDPELSKALSELMLTIIGGITTVFIPWAFAIARAYGNAKVAAIKNADMRKTMEFALTRLDETSRTVVDEINQKLRNANTEGKLPKEEARSLLTTAFKRLSVRLPQDVTATLKDLYGDNLQQVMVGKIESKVAMAKDRSC